MGGLLPVEDHPLLEQFLELGDCPQRLLADAFAAQVKAVVGVGGQVLAEAGLHRAHGALHDRLVGGGAQPRLAYLDAQGVAGAGEIRRDERRAVVDDECFRLDDGPCGGAGEAGVGGQEVLEGQIGAFHERLRRPAWPRGKRGYGLGNDLHGVEGAGGSPCEPPSGPACAAEPFGHDQRADDAAGRDTDRDREFHGDDPSVVTEDEDVQPSGVDLHQFPGPAGPGRPPGPGPRRRDRGASRMPGRGGMCVLRGDPQPFQQPVERRRTVHQPPGGFRVGEQVCVAGPNRLLHPVDQPGQRSR
ncbi:hypothetical protein WB401_30710 [Streptomyces brasiliscabiei]|uniref:hypothetical protein n=1 Tax=Streptomyces brasiliscabiei TaxID=2736302 RepID=UPI0030143863